MQTQHTGQPPHPPHTHPDQILLPTAAADAAAASNTIIFAAATATAAAATATAAAAAAASSWQEKPHLSAFYKECVTPTLGNARSYVM